jgi:hypothetical protein
VVGKGSEAESALAVGFRLTRKSLSLRLRRFFTLLALGSLP